MKSTKWSRDPGNGKLVRRRGPGDCAGDAGRRGRGLLLQALISERLQQILMGPSETARRAPLNAVVWRRRTALLDR